MYCQTTLLKSSPFNITSDPDLFFESNSHKEAFAALSYGIEGRKGIILISGEVGTGKTTLCKVLLNRLPSNIKTSVIFNPHFSEIQLLEAIIGDFGIEPEGQTKLDLINSLNKFLTDTSLQSGAAVVIIDESQNLTTRQLEQIRLLSNLETAKEKLLQIVLLGQPELEEKLARPQLRQIRQRIFVKYRLKPLAKEELKPYIEFRLKNNGQDSISIPDEGYNIIYNFSQGIPRLINMFCERALLCSFVNGKREWDLDILKSCLEELL